MNRPLLCLLVLVTAPVLAHEKQVHSDIVDLAFQVMLRAEVDPGLFAAPPNLPPGVVPTDAAALRNAMISATRFWGDAAVSLGAPRGSCGSASPQQWTRLRDANAAMSVSYQVGDDCLQSNWEQLGVLKPLPGEIPSPLRFVGPTLGYLAAHADDELGDSTLWVRPTAIDVFGTGPGAASTAVNEAVKVGLAVVFIPVVCIGKIFSGDLSCISQALDLANRANPVDDILGAVPGISATNTQSEKLIGLWHHINVTPFRSNDYDDVQGYLLDEAGPAGAQDELETVLMAIGDATGMSLNYNESSGPKRYEVAAGGDQHQNTVRRNKAEWQFETVSHTAFEPLDNLAWFGWNQFRLTRKAENLEWPLHAFGDAVSPMHVIGSPGWGHEPFEGSVQRDWNQIRYLDSADVLAQREQVRRIFRSALRFRQLVLAYRRTNNSKDVPVRDLITALARETYDSSMLTMVTRAWPFNPHASAEAVLMNGNSAFYFRPDNAELARPLIENGAGAVIAFLVSASEIP